MTKKPRQMAASATVRARGEPPPAAARMRSRPATVMAGTAITPGRVVRLDRGLPLSGRPDATRRVRQARLCRRAGPYQAAVAWQDKGGEQPVRPAGGGLRAIMNG